MPSIEMLTVNEAYRSVEDILEILSRALEYFPKGLWDGIDYLGNINMKYDVKVRFKEATYGAFILSNFIEKIRKIRRILQIKDLLLAVTQDPVIDVYPMLDYEKIRRVARLIHDFVSTDIGVVSLFNIEGEGAIKVTAHGLGHNRGLRHHNEPIDLMYEGLLRQRTISNEGFCSDCLKKILAKKEES